MIEKPCSTARFPTPIQCRPVAWCVTTILTQQCIAVLNARNLPIYLRVSPGEDAASTKYYFFAHSALDVVEERGAAVRLTQATQHAQPYLGLLTTIEDTMMYVLEAYSSYGYMTHTNVKFLLMLQLSDDPVQDNDVQTLFRAIRLVYVNYVSDPFVNVHPGDLPGSNVFGNGDAPSIAPSAETDAKTITSKKFDHEIETIAGWSSAAA